MSFVDDARLIQLAGTRAKDLFPVLERTSSLSALLVVLTVLPAVIAMQYDALSERDAAWRLRSVEMAFDAPAEGTTAATTSTQTAMPWHAPLGSWLAATMIHLPGPFGRHAFELVEYGSTALLIPVFYVFLRRLSGARIAFLSIVLFAFHGSTLQQFQNSAPHALGVLTALGSFSWFLRHLQRGNGHVSWELLAAGISLGLCLLSGGPLAFVVIIVLALFLLASFGQPQPARKPSGKPGPRTWSPLAGLKSLGLMSATAFAVGGWWLLKMLYSHGHEFLGGWLFGGVESVGSASPGATELLVRFLKEFLTTAGVMTGLVVLGAGVIGRDLFKPREGASRTDSRFLVVWLLIAFAAFLAMLRDLQHESLYDGMWRLFFMTACTACAAIAVDEISRRRVELDVFVGVTIATLFAGFGMIRWTSPESTPAAWIVIAGLALAALAGRTLRRFCEGSELRQRLVLGSLIAAYVLADAVIGIVSVHQFDGPMRLLTRFRNSLPASLEPERCVIISDDGARATVQFALKSVWPETTLLVARDWTDAVKQALGEKGSTRPQVVIDWSEGDLRPATPTGANLKTEPLGNPELVDKRQIRAYVLRSDPTTKDLEILPGRKSEADGDL